MSAIADNGQPRPGQPQQGAAPQPRPLLLSMASLQRGTLWLLVACGCIGFIEPSPYEVAFLLAFAVYALCGIRFSQKLLPMAVLLLLYNIGGTFSLIPWMDEPPSVRFMAVSVYLMITSVFFAAIMADDPLGRLDTMRKGYLMAAWVAGTAGIIGYFNIGGSGSFLALYGRASGTFKDPNVLGPFLVLPIVYLIQGILVGRISLLRGFLFMSIPLFGLFLTFSRGAWGNLVLATALMMLLMFLTSPNANRRARIIMISLACVLGIVAALGVALSFEGIRAIFEERASLEQSYDLGVTGRFGNQLRSIPLMLDNPNGLGPLRFRWHFPEDPHNVYINAFASYGWLGGISYAALTVATCYVGWRTVFQRTPWQNHAIAIWSVLFITILQGMQIDTDHWRHVYLLLGLTWGLASLPADHPPRA